MLQLMDRASRAEFQPAGSGSQRCTRALLLSVRVRPPIQPHLSSVAAHWPATPSRARHELHSGKESVRRKNKA